MTTLANLGLTIVLILRKATVILQFLYLGFDRFTGIPLLMEISTKG